MFLPVRFGLPCIPLKGVDHVRILCWEARRLVDVVMRHVGLSLLQ